METKIYFIHLCGDNSIYNKNFIFIFNIIKFTFLFGRKSLYRYFKNAFLIELSFSKNSRFLIKLKLLIKKMLICYFKLFFLFLYIFLLFYSFLRASFFSNLQKEIYHLIIRENIWVEII